MLCDGIYTYQQASRMSVIQYVTNLQRRLAMIQYTCEATKRRALGRKVGSWKP